MRAVKNDVMDISNLEARVDPYQKKRAIAQKVAD